MDDKTFLLFLLLITAFALLWLFVWGPQSQKAKEARAERERLKTEEREKLRLEREELLKSIRSGAPGFILQARLQFESDYRSRGGESVFGQEMSPLVCFGYRVGKTNGRTEAERRAILEYALAADYDVTLPFLPASYRYEWGAPFSARRLDRIYSHLNSMADLRYGRRNFEVAVAHWQADARWFLEQQCPRVEKYLAL